jgi:hypothetical protein
LPVLFLTAMSGLFARTSVSLSTSWFHNTVVVVISKYYLIAVILKMCFMLPISSCSHPQLPITTIPSLNYQRKSFGFYATIINYHSINWSNLTSATL